MKEFKITTVDEEPVVALGTEQCEITDIDQHGGIEIECELESLIGVSAAGVPEKLSIRVRSSDGFGTGFFHELVLQRESNVVRLYFMSHTPNKVWEGRFGLATFIRAAAEQVAFHESLSVTHTEVDDDWKAITIASPIKDSDGITDSINSIASLLAAVLRDAEIALAGLSWKPGYQTDEDLFCRELLHPLLRRMAFLHVRYTHGKKEYGKDFTFSEMTSFGTMRHYGLQAKAGNISGEVNSETDELLGQIADAFAMPYYSIGSNEPHFISTFIIAISGHFTENAREKIVQKMAKGLVGSVFFLDRESLDELIERFWKK